MHRSMVVALLLLAPVGAAADEGLLHAFGEDVRQEWAACPFVLYLAQRQADRTLGLALDGKIVLDGSIAPRVEYSVKLKRGRLRVRVFASGKSAEPTGWHAPDTDPGDKHTLERESPGLAAIVEANDLESPLVGIFKTAVEQCLGVPAR